MIEETIKKRSEIVKEYCKATEAKTEEERKLGKL